MVQKITSYGVGTRVSRAFDRVSHGYQGVLAPPAKHQLNAFPCEEHRGCTAYSGACTRDQNALTRQLKIHETRSYALG